MFLSKTKSETDTRQLPCCCTLNSFLQNMVYFVILQALKVFPRCARTLLSSLPSRGSSCTSTSLAGYSSNLPVVSGTNTHQINVGQCDKIKYQHVRKQERPVNGSCSGERHTLRLETCSSLPSSSLPPLGRFGICLTSFLVAVCLFTV